MGQAVSEGERSEGWATAREQHGHWPSHTTHTPTAPAANTHHSVALPCLTLSRASTSALASISPTMADV